MYVSHKTLSAASAGRSPIRHWQGQAAYREILGLAYVRAFSSGWSNAECGRTILNVYKKSEGHCFYFISIEV